MKEYLVTIKGTAPLLMHRFDEEAQAQLMGEVKKAKTDPGTSAEQAERAAYRMVTGDQSSNLYIPGEALYNAIVKASGGLKVKGGRGKSYKGSAQGNVNIVPEFIDLGTHKFEIDLRRVRVQSRACMRSRPRVDNWQATFTIQVFDDEAIPAEVVNEMIATAGQQVGLLDYRPRFGRFMVTEFREV